MDYPFLSPELREKLRCLALKVRGRGFATVEELDLAFGPREVTADLLEDALSYLSVEHSISVEDRGGIFTVRPG